MTKGQRHVRKELKTTGLTGPDGLAVAVIFQSLHDLESKKFMEAMDAARFLVSDGFEYLVQQLGFREAVLPEWATARIDEIILEMEETT